MTHRKHIHEWEIDPVATVLREHLTSIVPKHNPKNNLPTDITQQFRVLYRFENHSVGPPSYPKPETWGTLAEYLGVMVPLSHPIREPQQPPKQPQIPESRLEHQCPSCGTISPNPLYCTYCGAAMEVPAQ